MNLADVATVVLVILGLLLLFVAWWLAVAGLFPNAVARCAADLGTAPLKCWLAGVACAVPLFVAGTLLSQRVPNPAAKILGVALILATIFAGLAGAAGLALRIGGGLASARDASEPWRRVLRGGIVLALTFLFFLWLPLALLAGLGALVRSWMSKPAPAPEIPV
ncbi:MAG: hypothetical protein RLZZ15_1321 [Verrucomicrobiota bacterium]|jgi:hypothetical protein